MLQDRTPWALCIEERMVMAAAIGADHAGADLMSHMSDHMLNSRIAITGFGNPLTEGLVDYPNVAARVAQLVNDGAVDVGILVCATGLGMAIAANRWPNVRAAPCRTVEDVEATRRHNGANVLCLGSRWTTPEHAGGLIDAFFSTAFKGEHHHRRVDQLTQLPHGQ